MHTSISIRYKGPAVDNGLMDVYQASNNMIAFSEFMVAAVKSKYGDQTDVKAEVAGFEHGSFITNLVMEVGGPAISLFSTLSPKDIYSIVKDAIALWKFLKGKPPASVSYLGPNATVTNNNGHIIQIQTESLNLVLSDKGADSAGRFVREALLKDGIESVNISGTDDELADVQKNEADYFVPIATETKISENVVTVSLILLAPNFQDGNKWRFNEGGGSNISAAMADEDFLRRVNNGERFGKGDILQVEMHVQQNKAGNQMKVERRILKVLDHKAPHEQESLFSE